MVGRQSKNIITNFLSHWIDKYCFETYFSRIFSSNNGFVGIGLGISMFCFTINVMCCAIWYHLYNLKKVKNTHWGMLISVKLQAEACNFTKINTPRWVFFTFFQLHKWYQIAQRTANVIISYFFTFIDGAFSTSLL